MRYNSRVDDDGSVGGGGGDDDDYNDDVTYLLYSLKEVHKNVF